MGFLSIFGISPDFVKIAESRDLDRMSSEFERKLSILDQLEELLYEKEDIIQLIGTIETDKIRFLQGSINGKRFYEDVDRALTDFKLKYPRFDYLNDPALKAYFT